MSMPGNMPPRGPVGPSMGGAPGGIPPQMLQAIMRMVPPQVMQAAMANPAIIPQLVQKFLPMLLGGMGGGAPRGMPMPPGRMPPPGAFSGNAPKQPPAQGAIGPSDEEELAETQAAMGAKKRRMPPV